MWRLLLILSLAVPVAGARVDKDVVYGMRSGLALLMDVYYPEQPNGRGVVMIPVAAGTRRRVRRKAAEGVGLREAVGLALVKAGYTVFVINRPRCAAVPAPGGGRGWAAGGAVRASGYGVDPQRLGGIAAVRPAGT
ncbi:MAG: hypothetical protein R2748_31455 [Bryobacterales bacterium]